MNDDKLEKRPTRVSLKKKGPYALAFGIVALMLYVVGFPVFILIFFGVIVFFIWKAFSAGSDNETKRIFDFYLSASEILREDGRKWFGFEVHEAIAKGTAIAKSIPSPPPLVYFTLGALQQKIGDHSAALENLEKVAGADPADEMSIVHPSPEFREYVRVLRKIERSPADAPLTSSAVRSLERLRRGKGSEMLENSRRLASVPMPTVDVSEKLIEGELPPQTRSTISEVLHDIYDDNIQ